MKKFRFESFAIEFPSTPKPSTNIDNNADDSGIDSEELPISPPICRLPEADDQPLSLVLREQNSGENSKTRTPPVKRHWKKFLKERVKNEPRESPSKTRFNIGDAQDEAENLCLNDLRRRHTESTVAHALLSLGMNDNRPHQRPLTNLAQHHTVTFPARSSPSNSFRDNSSETIQLPQHPFLYSNLFLAQESQRHMPMKELTNNHAQIFMSPFHSQAILADQITFRPSQTKFTNDSTLHTMRAPPSDDVRQIQSKKPYYCSDCKKGFSTQSGFIKHEELHRANQIQKNFTCKFCSKGYTSLSALKMHTRTHTLPCKCHICGKSFSRPWLLQGHVRTHTGEKPFSCGYCSRCFADKSNLRAHLQTHMQTKKYSCQGCQKTFSRMSLLNKHSENGCPGLKPRPSDSFSSTFRSGLLRA